MNPLACRLICLAVGSTVLIGCASTPPSSFYTLSPLPETLGGRVLSGGELAIGLGPVSFPVFLDRPQIVSRESNNRLALDEFHRWGGTLQDDFLRVWSENLAYLLATSRLVVFPSEVRARLDYRVSADVLAFEGTPDGQAVLRVRWSVLDPALEQVMAVHENAYHHPVLEPRDETALIAAMSAALGDFSRDVAAAVRALPPREPMPDQVR